MAFLCMDKLGDIAPIFLPTMTIILDELVFTFHIETNAPVAYGQPVTGKAVDANDNKVATLSGYCVTNRSHSGQLARSMKIASKSMQEFSVVIFNEHGVLKPCIKEGYRSGTAIWGEELNVGILVFIENITVDVKLQRLGIGSLMLKKLGEFAHIVAPSTNIICRPPQNVHKRDVFNAFVRKNGFRRIGRTEFLAFSMDPDHPSHTLAVADDVPSLADLYPPPMGGTTDFRKERYPLHNAILTVKTPAIRDTLTAANSEPDLLRARDDSGYRLLHVAVLASNKIAFDTLIALGAAVDLKAHDNVEGVTPLEALQDKLEGARASLWSGAFNDAMEMEFAVKNAMGIDMEASSTQQYIRMRRHGCTCGKCVKGWLSPRMAYRLACEADFASRAMSLDCGKFKHQHPITAVQDLYLGDFIPPSLHPKVNKAFYEGFIFVIGTIRDILLTSPIPCLSGKVVVQKAAQLTQTAAFFHAGGKTMYALDALTSNARDASELFDGTFLEIVMNDPVYLELPICCNDLDFKMAREETGLDPALKWAPYPDVDSEDESEDEYDYFDGDEDQSEDEGDMRSLLKERLQMFRRA